MRKLFPDLKRTASGFFYPEESGLKKLFRHRSRRLTDSGRSDATPETPTGQIIEKRLLSDDTAYSGNFQAANCCKAETTLHASPVEKKYLSKQLKFFRFPLRSAPKIIFIFSRMRAREKQVFIFVRFAVPFRF